MKKRNMIFLMAAMLCLLSACGKETDVDTNTVIIEKKGQITEAIVEDFEQPYYDQEELKREIEDKISQFNTQSGDGKEAVELEKIELEDKVIRVNITFPDSDAYTSFNEKQLFAGKVADVYARGYSFPQMKSVDGSQISEADVLELGDKNAVLLEEQQQVKVHGKITHISDGISLVDEKTAVNLNEGQMGCIIYE